MRIVWLKPFRLPIFLAIGRFYFLELFVALRILESGNRAYMNGGNSAFWLVFFVEDTRAVMRGWAKGDDTRDNDGNPISRPIRVEQVKKKTRENGKRVSNKVESFLKHGMELVPARQKRTE